MKLRLIQLTGLFAFVMAIMMLVPLDEGVGGDPSAHVPDLWINGDATSDNYGKLETPDNPGPHLIDTAVDPRRKSFNEMCGTNGDESVGGFAWYYRGGKLSDSEGHKKEKEDTTSDEHLNTYKQNVYTIYLNGSAQTSATEASGSLDPGISDPEGIALSAAHETESFKGMGKIDLEIYQTDYHDPKYKYRNGKFRYYVGCDTHTSDEYYFRMKAPKVLKVVVHIEEVTKSRSGSISGGVSAKGASSSFTYEWSWAGKYWKKKGLGFGMKASVGGWSAAYWDPVIKLQKKSATVDGNVEDATLPTLEAEYDKRNSWCPPDSSGHSAANVPHVK